MRRQCVDCRKRARPGDWYCGECAPDTATRPPAPDPTAAEAATIARFGIFAEEEGR